MHLRVPFVMSLFLEKLPAGTETQTKITIWIYFAPFPAGDQLVLDILYLVLQVMLMVQ